MSERIAIFGDVSGHYRPLAASLLALRIDLEKGLIPTDLIVISVGDLVHKGGDSDRIVELVDRFLRRNPDRWIQLIGNHEAEHLGGSTTGFCNCSTSAVATIQRWRDESRVAVAVSLRASRLGSEPTEALVTHAGLGQKAWVQIGSPSTAEEASRLLNDQFRVTPDRVFEPGLMLGHDTNTTPGPVWAEAPNEVYATWLDADMPFDQIHGHTSPYYWGGQRWSDFMPQNLQRLSRADVKSRRSQTQIGGRKFVSLDPGFTQKFAAKTLPAYLLEGQILG